MKVTFEGRERQRFKLHMNLMTSKLEITIKRELGVEKRKIKYMVNHSFVLMQPLKGDKKEATKWRH